VSCAIKLLAYCVTHDSAPRSRSTGVGGAPVQAMNVDTLWCTYSPLILPPQEFSREDALTFHSVLKAALSKKPSFHSLSYDSSE